MRKTEETGRGEGDLVGNAELLASEEGGGTLVGE